MRYILLQQRSKNIITIGEYIKEQQPKVFMLLQFLKQKAVRAAGRDVTELILTAADVRGADKQYQHLMQERPRPGKGGLLPGEKEEDLYEKL
jgi:hypothetical protein